MKVKSSIKYSVTVATWNSAAVIEVVRKLTDSFFWIVGIIVKTELRKLFELQVGSTQVLTTCSIPLMENPDKFKHLII